MRRLQAKTTYFSDKEQMQALARMIPLLGSTEDALKALPVLMDAATVAQTNLNSVASTFTRALSGQANTAESVGLTFDELMRFEERLQVATNAIGGAAAANVDPFIQMGNAVGDLKEG